MTDREQLAEAVREACVRAALEAYEDGGLRGLCAEGRWEYVVQILKTFELTQVVHEQPETGSVKEAG